MTNELDQLASREDELISKIPENGFFEQRIPQVERDRLPEQWIEIFDGYVKLLDDPELGTEALRRAVFLAWISFNSPWPLTGIKDFPKEVVRIVLARLNQTIVEERCDPELRAMLRGYGTGLPFEIYPEFRALNQLLKSINGPYSLDTPIGEMNGRGMMGKYWLGRGDYWEVRHLKMPPPSKPSLWADENGNEPSEQEKLDRLRAILEELQKPNEKDAVRSQRASRLKKGIVIIIIVLPFLVTMLMLAIMDWSFGSSTPYVQLVLAIAFLAAGTSQGIVMLKRKNK